MDLREIRQPKYIFVIFTVLLTDLILPLASSSGQMLSIHPSASTISLEPNDLTNSTSQGPLSGLRRCASGTSIAGTTSVPLSFPFNNIYTSIWRALMMLTSDPHPEVVRLAKEVVGYIKDKVSQAPHLSF